MLYLDNVPNVEVGVQVDGPFVASGRVTPSQLPAGSVATTVHRGAYDGLGAAHEAVRAFGAPPTGTRSPAHVGRSTATGGKTLGSSRPEIAYLLQ